jgi:hypothetical protein
MERVSDFTNPFTAGSPGGPDGDGAGSSKAVQNVAGSVPITKADYDALLAAVKNARYCAESLMMCTQ